MTLARLPRVLLDRVRRQYDADWYRARGMTIGEAVSIGRGSVFDTGFLQLISVGDHVTLSAGVEVLAHDASMRRHLGYTLIAPVKICSRVYIGAGAIILPGITIGEGAVVGAGSVVTRDVPAGAVAAGNPARVISDVEALVAKHRAQLAQRPAYPSRGWTTWNGGISAERRREMREALSNGPGYIE